MTFEDVINCIEGYLADHAHGPPPGRDENLFVSGAVDSMTIMKLIAFLETTYAVKIPPGDLIPDHFKTVQAMAEYMSTTYSDT